MIDTRIGRRGRWIRLVVAPVGALALVGLTACGTGTEHEHDVGRNVGGGRPALDRRRRRRHRRRGRRGRRGLR